jgi:ASC-1-like (ASCH) protein
MKIKKKVKQQYFQAVKDGKKRFEVRLADFESSPGDILVLQEQNEEKGKPTGRELECEILYKFNTQDMEKFHTKEELEKHGLVVLAIRKHYKHNT